MASERKSRCHDTPWRLACQEVCDVPMLVDVPEDMQTRANSKSLILLLVAASVQVNSGHNWTFLSECDNSRHFDPYHTFLVGYSRQEPAQALSPPKPLLKPRPFTPLGLSRRKDQEPHLSQPVPIPTSPGHSHPPKAQAAGCDHPSSRSTAHCASGGDQGKLISFQTCPTAGDGGFAGCEEYNGREPGPRLRRGAFHVGSNRRFSSTPDQ